MEREKAAEREKRMREREEEERKIREEKERQKHQVAQHFEESLRLHEQKVYFAEFLGQYFVLLL
jgi:hypothetical protein